MPRMMQHDTKHLYRAVVTRPLYNTDVTVTRYYGPYLLKGTASQQGKRAAGKAGTYAVQRLTIGVGVWEQEKPATWEPVRG